jgi:uncharacterized membrane protein
MHDLTSWFLLLFAGVTTLMMVLAVPLIRGRVRPNLIYGLRTPKTLGDEGAWYRANAYGGRLLFGSGLVQLVAVVALYCVPRLRADFVAYNLACGAVIVGSILVIGALLMRRLRSL